MKQGVEKPHSDTQGQFCSITTQSELPPAPPKTKQNGKKQIRIPAIFMSFVRLRQIYLKM